MVAFVRIGGISHSRGEQVHDLPLGVAARLPHHDSAAGIRVLIANWRRLLAGWRELL